MCKGTDDSGIIYMDITWTTALNVSNNILFLNDFIYY